MEEILQSMVSVIIPLYNCEDYIEECLDSVLNQKYRNIEVIVVDDGSTDNGPTIVERYKDVKLIRQSNQGVTAARKAGVAAAKGEWVMFVDADDAVEENIISDWLPLMRNDVDIIIGKMKWNKEVSTQQLVYDILEIRRFPTVPWLKLIRHELFDKADILNIPRSIVWGEDMMMLFRLAFVVKGKVIYSRKRNYLYRRHPSQVTKTFRVTSDYEQVYHTLLMTSVQPNKLNTRLMEAFVKYRLPIYERILKDAKFSQDQVETSEWKSCLLKDIDAINFRPSLWYKTILRYGTGKNIKLLRSVKWAFKCINAYKM